MDNKKKKITKPYTRVSSAKTYKGVKVFWTLGCSNCQCTISSLTTDR